MLKVQNMKKVFEKKKSQILLSKSEKHLLNLLNVKSKKKHPFFCFFFLHTPIYLFHCQDT